MASYIIQVTDPFSKKSFSVNAYTSNGPVFPLTTNLDTTAVQANTSFVFYGKSHPSYGERLQENILHLLENFSGPSEPKNALSGQLWFKRYDVLRTSTGWFSWDDTLNTWNAIAVLQGVPVSFTHGEYWENGGTLSRVVNIPNHPLSPSTVPVVFTTQMTVSDPNAVNAQPIKELCVFDGLSWNSVNRVHSDNLKPQLPKKGDIWFDEAHNILTVFDGTDFAPIGGDYLASIGGTLTGDLNMDGNNILGLPAAAIATGATSKEYVDTLINDTTTTLTGLINATGALPTDFTVPASTDLPYLKYDTGSMKWKPGAVTMAFTDLTDVTGNTTLTVDNLNSLEGVTTPITDLLDTKLSVNGGIVGGDLLMNGNSIRGLTVLPANDDDAANKKYVDDMGAASNTYADAIGATGIASTATLIDPLIANVQYDPATSAFIFTRVNATDVIAMVASKDHTHPVSELTRTVITTAPDVNTITNLPVYTISNSSLTVYRNGIKLIEDTRAVVNIITQTPIQPTDDTGLVDGTDYTFTVDYAGAGANTLAVTATAGYSFEQLKTDLEQVLPLYTVELLPTGIRITAPEAGKSVNIVDVDLFGAITGTTVAPGPWNVADVQFGYRPVGAFGSISTTIEVHDDVDWTTTNIEIIG